MAKLTTVAKNYSYENKRTPQSQPINTHAANKMLYVTKQGEVVNCKTISNDLLLIKFWGILKSTMMPLENFTKEKFTDEIQRLVRYLADALHQADV